jgi:5-formyltetrahydrofolate cyclo-ligase
LTIALTKKDLRAAVGAARRELSLEDRAARSRAIAERVAALPVFAAARTVALYAPMGAEVDTAPIALLALEAGKRIAYPRQRGTDREMGFATCAAAALVAGPLRTQEPPADAPAVPLDELDLVIVPGLAFDPSCRRLGRGGGHYDATLACVPRRAARVGVAFEVQIVPEVPEEPHDAPLDAVVTEARILFPWRGPGPAGNSPR